MEGITRKVKRLRHWLCSSHQLLRGSQQRGCMYRHSLRCDHCFRSSKPQLFLADPVGFFGSGCPPGCPARLITQSTSVRQRFIFAKPFDRRREQPYQLHKQCQRPQLVQRPRFPQRIQQALIRCTSCVCELAINLVLIFHSNLHSADTETPCYC